MVAQRIPHILAIIALWSGLLVPLAVVAEGHEALPPEVAKQLKAVSEGAGTQTGSGQGTLPQVVARIVNGTLSLMGVVLVALLVYAGYLWMTAAGEEEKLTKAKQIIRNAIIGLFIVLAAYGISILVINRLLYATEGGTRPK